MLVWNVQVTKISKLSVLLEVSPLICDFCQEKNKVKYWSYESYHRWKFVMLCVLNLHKTLSTLALSSNNLFW